LINKGGAPVNKGRTRNKVSRRSPQTLRKGLTKFKVHISASRKERGKKLGDQIKKAGHRRKEEQKSEKETGFVRRAIRPNPEKWHVAKRRYQKKV